MNKKFNSISIRLSLRFTIILTVAVLVLAIAFLGLIHSFISSGQDFELRKAADNVENMVLNLTNQNRNSENQKKNDEKNRVNGQEIPYYISFLVADSQGELVHSNDPFLPFLPDTNGGTKRLIKKNFFIDGDLNILYFTKKVLIGEKVFFVMTSMDMTRESAERIFDSLPKSILLAILPILVISFFISLLITSRTMKPVVQVTKAASRISISNLGIEKLAPSKHDDEIQDLISTFNKLFERLKIDFDREKQFTSDVSHELKTPIAVILGQTNLLLRWGKDEPEQLQKSLDSIKKETKSMEAIISNLLQISRLENGKVKPNFENIDLNELFVRLQDEFKAVSPNSLVTTNVNSTFVIKTDSELLHQVLTVIVSNSVKYVGNDCKISIFVAKNENGKIKIKVEDNGTGFSDEVLPHVFERFYRGDEAHTRRVGGSGLGLSIAKVIVESLGGKISASNSENHGAVITVEL